MNRIVLIGNGFDLAHGLPTSYQHFINNYWTEWIERLKICTDEEEQDEFYQFSIKNQPYHREATLKDFITWGGVTVDSYNGLVEQINTVNNRSVSAKMSSKCLSLLFNNINNAYLTRWLDIENEYYTLLKNTGLEDKKFYTDPDSLNCDLERIGNKLEKYLSDLQKDKITLDIINGSIKRILYEPFRFKDISMDGKDSFYHFLDSRIDSTSDPYNINPLMSKYGFSPLQEGRYIDLYMKAISDKSDKYEYHRKLVTEGKWDIHPYFLLPENIMFLSFNYTNTIDLYIDKKTEFEVNHVHGKLNDPDNPMIFGYGDELDEHYKKIENLNDNKYLKNIKSVHYLKTDNLRKLRSFIDSAPYQIIILGHSCGNPDRTLLNTLFEHKNCISIKPYFYEREDGTDDYINIIQNISRNFNDKTLMRDRVVNKSYCDPLPQN